MKSADEVRMFLVDTANDMIEDDEQELAEDLRTLAKYIELGGSQTERELVTLLSDYVGETGETESAVEVLSRLLTELEGFREVSSSLVEKYEMYEFKSYDAYIALKDALGVKRNWRNIAYD